MFAVYDIKDCCGNLLETIEIDLPTTYPDPNGRQAQTFAVAKSHFVYVFRTGACRDCRGLSVKGRPEAHAIFKGYPIDSVGADVTIEADNRDMLIATLETLLRETQRMPVCVGFISCNNDRAIIG